MLFIVVDSEDSDWLAWLYPSPSTATHRFSIVIMALDGAFIMVDGNDNFLENNVVCTMLLLAFACGDPAAILRTLFCVKVSDVERGEISLRR